MSSQTLSAKMIPADPVLVAGIVYVAASEGGNDGRKEWRRRFPGPAFFISSKDKGNRRLAQVL
jgi:hypothetical protein